MLVKSSRVVLNSLLLTVFSNSDQNCREGQISARPHGSSCPGLWQWLNVTGPSRVRTTSPMLISAGGRDKSNPPCAPRLASTKPARLSRLNICYKYGSEISSICDIFAVESGCLALAIANSALTPYLPRVDIAKIHSSLSRKVSIAILSRFVKILLLHVKYAASVGNRRG